MNRAKESKNCDINGIPLAIYKGLMTVSRILTERKKTETRNEQYAPILLCVLFFFPHIAGSLFRKQTNSAIILELLLHHTHQCRQHRELLRRI